jgi:hypothetical protein
MGRLKISALTKKEFNAIVEAANFSDQQLELFTYLSKDMYDVAIINRMAVSPNSYYKLKKITVDKIVRVAVDLGYISLIKTK